MLGGGRERQPEPYVRRRGSSTTRDCLAARLMLASTRLRVPPHRQATPLEGMSR